MKLKYPQPHNMRRVKTGNQALDANIIEKGHAREKHLAKMTQSQRRIYKRREKILDLASHERIYCQSHERYLCVKDIEERRCYMRHGNPPICPHLMWERVDGTLKKYGK